MDGEKELSKSEEWAKEWNATVRNYEWYVLHHALNIARLNTSRYMLDDEGHWSMIGGDVDHYLEGERLMLDIYSKKLLQSRELSVNEHLSEGAQFITPP